MTVRLTRYMVLSCRQVLMGLLPCWMTMATRYGIRRRSGSQSRGSWWSFSRGRSIWTGVAYSLFRRHHTPCVCATSESHLLIHPTHLIMFQDADQGQSAQLHMKKGQGRLRGPAEGPKQHHPKLKSTNPSNSCRQTWSMSNPRIFQQKIRIRRSWHVPPYGKART